MNRPLSPREKVLAIGVAVIALVLVNWFLIDLFWHKSTRLRSDITAKTKQLRQMHSLSGELALWEQRDAWTQSRQPRLVNADAAGVELLNQVKELAREHAVLLENPAIRRPEQRPACVSVVVELETKSPWKPLVAFLRELQSPERFIAVESANLRVDAADPTQMRGRLMIARWYAPR